MAAVERMEAVATINIIVVDPCSDELRDPARLVHAAARVMKGQEQPPTAWTAKRTYVQAVCGPTNVCA
ncbi:hypothetical protein NDU88_006836 [Pleurodeles waltl]|uniref:Uncharacterized protein n=1 Tax=Pleurodeles waltl TaxID=8319 RepID=A0AAV7MDZ7_PLEWA|nr:hypothetical protein NDU88_006836 [Pleurodeles waltl]